MAVRPKREGFSSSILVQRQPDSQAGTRTPSQPGRQPGRLAGTILEHTPVWRTCLQSWQLLKLKPKQINQNKKESQRKPSRNQTKHIDSISDAVEQNAKLLSQVDLEEVFWISTHLQTLPLVLLAGAWQPPVRSCVVHFLGQQIWGGCKRS